VLDVGLGVLFVVLVVHAGRAKLNPEKVAKLHKRITDFASSNPLQVFLAGIGVAALISKGVFRGKRMKKILFVGQ
jgi:Na+/citrate or Na+/malate symporter